jgi:aldose 1-epimerase
MAFEIQISSLFDFKKVQLIDSQNGVVIDITTKGALMNSWQVAHHHKMLQLVHGNDFSNGWSHFEQEGFRGAKMSPFACRMKSGKYELLGKPYTIEKFYLNKDAIHGIVYDAIYSIQNTQANEHGAFVILKHTYMGIDQGYPFNFTILVKWHLQKNNKISVESIITNQTAQAIPMMDGWHPYFSIGGLMNDCSLTFKNKGKVVFNDQLLPTGQVMEDDTFNHSRKIETRELDNCFILDPNQKDCVLENDEIKLVVQAEMNYPYLQLYIPPDRKSIAIENLSGAPNCFNNKMGLLMMKPHESLVFKTNYQFFIKL